MPARNENLLDWLALGTVPDIGSFRCRLLIGKFGSPREVFKASKGELENLEGIGSKSAHKIKNEVDWKAAEKQLEIIERSNYKLVTYNSSEYPERLKNIYDPPPLLFCDGQTEYLDTPAVGVVGSRSASTYGRIMAEKLATELVEAGLTVISGFARGIDTIAHKSSLNAGGRTVAVFGCGLDVIYPPENKTLYKKLVLNGCAVSEFFLGSKPEPHFFPRRNRIISGLSLGILVIEAGNKSGALLTVNHALEQNREIFAVPGNINSPMSAGTNRIIKQGAKLVTSAEDVLEELKYQVSSSGTVTSNRPEPNLEGAHKLIYEVLNNQPIQVDKLVKKTGLEISKTLEILLDLELNGLVKQLSGKMFVKQP